MTCCVCNSSGAQGPETTLGYGTSKIAIRFRKYEDHYNFFSRSVLPEKPEAWKMKVRGAIKIMSDIKVDAAADLWTY